MSFSIGGGGLRMGPRGAIQNFGDSEEGRAFDRRIVRRLLVFCGPTGCAWSSPLCSCSSPRP